MKKLLTGVIIAVLSIFIVAAVASASDFETWYVGAPSGLNCRAQPNSNSDILTTYSPKTELQIIGTDGGSWWETWDGKTQGWVYAKYMTDSPDNVISYSSPSTVSYENMTCLGTYRITEYTPDPSENGGASEDRKGNPLAPQVGQICAVDGKNIPYDRTIYIEGIGYRKTADSGVYGRVVDVLTWGNTGITGDYTVYLVN